MMFFLGNQKAPLQNSSNKVGRQFEVTAKLSDESQCPNCNSLNIDRDRIDYRNSRGDGPGHTRVLLTHCPITVTFIHIFSETTASNVPS